MWIVCCPSDKDVYTWTVMHISTTRPHQDLQLFWCNHSVIEQHCVANMNTLSERKWTKCSPALYINLLNTIFCIQRNYKGFSLVIFSKGRDGQYTAEKWNSISRVCFNQDISCSLCAVLSPNLRNILITDSEELFGLQLTTSFKNKVPKIHCWIPFDWRNRYYWLLEEEEKWVFPRDT